MSAIPLTADPHIWADPSVPLTVPSHAGRRAIVDIATVSGERPFGFAVSHDPERGQLTVSWPGIVCFGDNVSQYESPVPAGPLMVAVIAPA